MFPSVVPVKNGPTDQARRHVAGLPSGHPQLSRWIPTGNLQRNLASGAHVLEGRTTGFEPLKCEEKMKIDEVKS